PVSFSFFLSLFFFFFLFLLLLLLCDLSLSLSPLFSFSFLSSVPFSSLLFSSSSLRLHSPSALFFFLCNFTLSICVI
ncbi:unnamed protein product, partial [Prunus brigantina]